MAQEKLTRCFKCGAASDFFDDDERPVCDECFLGITFEADDILKEIEDEIENPQDS